MRTIELKVYAFDELSDGAKAKAIQRLSDIIKLNYEWWDSTYEDARMIKLKLTEFDLDRNKYCKGMFIASAPETAELIIANHGKDCDTYKTAQAFLSNLNYLTSKHENIDDVSEEAIDDLEYIFLQDLLEDYADLLQKDCDYLQSEEAIIETIRANEYEFYEDGRLM